MRRALVVVCLGLALAGHAQVVMEAGVGWSLSRAPLTGSDAIATYQTTVGAAGDTLLRLTPELSLLLAAGGDAAVDSGSGLDVTEAWAETSLTYLRQLLLLELGVDGSVEATGVLLGSPMPAGGVVIDGVISLGSFDYAVSLAPRVGVAWPTAGGGAAHTTAGGELTGSLTLLENILFTATFKGEHMWIGDVDTSAALDATLDADWFPRLPLFASATVGAAWLETTVGQQPLAPFGPTLSGSYWQLSGVVELGVGLGRTISVSALVSLVGQWWPDGLDAQLELTETADLQLTVEPVVRLALVGASGQTLALSGAYSATNASSPFRVQHSWSVQLDLATPLVP